MKRILKWLGIIVGGLLAVVIVLGAVLHLMGANRLNNAPEVAGQPVTVPTDADAVARGAQLATISSCNGCHGLDLGGTVFMDGPPFGYVPAPNLTGGAGGVGATYDAADWEMAIRHGVGQDGRRLVVMSSQHYAAYGDDDLGALIAYLQSAEPVDNPLDARRITFPGTIIFGVLAGGWSVDRIDHAAVGGPAPQAAASAEYGAYLFNVASCGSCHGDDLAGQTDPNAPQGPNITPGGDIGGWDSAEFVTAMRTGVTPSGRTLTDEMPWRAYADMSDTELAALWTYMRSVPSRAASAP